MWCMYGHRASILKQMKKERKEKEKNGADLCKAQFNLGLAKPSLKSEVGVLRSV